MDLILEPSDLGKKIKCFYSILLGIHVLNIFHSIDQEEIPPRIL